MLSILDDEVRSERREEERNLDAREEGGVLVVRAAVHRVDGGKVYIAGG